METWKNIPGYDKYQVSNFGKIKSFMRNKNGKILNFRIDLHGYHEIKLYKEKTPKIFRVNRLVYFSFNGGDLLNYNPKKRTIVCHKNDIRSDNRLENLFLGTQSDNIKDCVNKGRHTSQK